MTRRQALAAIKVVIDDFTGRRGFHVLDQIRSEDPDLWEEMIEGLVPKVIESQAAAVEDEESIAKGWREGA